MKNNFKNPLIIYNPKAADCKGEKIFKKFYKKLVGENLFDKIDVYETCSKAGTIDKIKEVHDNKSGIDLLISIGGDGSISTVCNGIMQAPIKDRLPIMPLPSGSGNSFLRDFDIMGIDAAIKKYKNGSPKLLDVLKVEEVNGDFKWYSVNVLGLGFISDIADFVVRHGKKLGAFSYVLGSVLALGKFRPHDTVIKYDNGKKEFRTNKAFFISCSNTKHSGGSIMIAPDAKYDDGLLDVVVLHDINRMQFVNGLRKVFKGGHIHDKGCLYFKTTDVEIHSNPDFSLMPDGELEGHSPVKVSVLPKQIKFIV